MENLVFQVVAEIVKITIHAMPDRPGIAASIFTMLNEAGFTVALITASGGADGRADVSFTVLQGDADKVMQLLEGKISELKAQKISKDINVVSISLVAEELQRTPGVAGRMFRTLSTAGINIIMISTTTNSVTVVIPLDKKDQALNYLRREFTAELTVS